MVVADVHVDSQAPTVTPEPFTKLAVVDTNAAVLPSPVRLQTSAQENVESNLEVIIDVADSEIDRMCDTNDVNDQCPPPDARNVLMAQTGPVRQHTQPLEAPLVVGLRASIANLKLLFGTRCNDVDFVCAQLEFIYGRSLHPEAGLIQQLLSQPTYVPCDGRPNADLSVVASAGLPHAAATEIQRDMCKDPDSQRSRSPRRPSRAHSRHSTRVDERHRISSESSQRAGKEHSTRRSR